MAERERLELQRVNAEIVGHLLARRSPPRDLIARKEQLLAGVGYCEPQPRRMAMSEPHGARA